MLKAEVSSGLKFHTINWITGLRAVSFLLVFGYHLNPGVVPNGYLGVDIFFVISGFVISKQIYENWNGKIFGNFKVFYLNRARRLLPSLFFVLTIVSISTLVAPNGKQIENFQNPISWILLWISNLYFREHTNYFSDIQILQPWIHTWSLSVEEQFYIIFPAFFICILFFSKSVRVFTISLGILSSAFLQIYFASGHPTSTFYLLPFRAWEFLFGVLAWELSKKFDGLKYQKFSSVIARIELPIWAMIYFIIFQPYKVIDNSASQFSLVLFIFFMLLSWRSEGLSKKFLNRRSLIWAGALSYQLYLWHQPVIVWLYPTFNSKPFLFYSYSVIGTLLLGKLTYVLFVDFYRNSNVQKPLTFCLLLCLWALLISGIQQIDVKSTNLGNASYLRAIEQSAIDLAYKRDKCFLTTGSPSKYAPSCNIKKYNNILVWGDSQGAALASGFADSSVAISQNTFGSCPPVLEYSKGSPCASNNHRILKTIDLSTQGIFLVADWRQYLTNEFMVNLERTISKLKLDFPGRDYVIVGQAPFWNPKPPLLPLPSNPPTRRLVFSYNPQHAELDKTNLLLGELAAKLDIDFIDPSEFLCHGTRCLLMIKVQGAYELSSNDGSHLNPISAKYLVSQLQAKKGILFSYALN